MTLRAAIIGCGRIAGGYDRQVPDATDPNAWSATHAGAYLLSPDTKLVSAADPSDDARIAFAHKWLCPNMYADHAKMLSDQAHDLVSICAPTGTHADVFEAAINAGAKGIVLEKPVATNLSDAERMQSLSGSIPVVVNFTRRFNPSFAEIAANIHNGLYGCVLNAVFRYTKGLVVNGSHHIDTARWFFGDPLRVTHLKTKTGEGDDPGMDFCLTFDNDIDAYFLNVPNADFVFFDIELITEKGRLRITQRGQQIAFDEVVTEPHYGLFNIISPKHTDVSQWKNCATRAIQNLADCVNDRAQPQCTLDDGIQVMRVINTLKEAS